MIDGAKNFSVLTGIIVHLSDNAFFAIHFFLLYSTNNQMMIVQYSVITLQEPQNNGKMLSGFQSSKYSQTVPVKGIARNL